MIEPEILFEDSELLVIDKPAGMVVNKSDTSRYVKTVQEWAEKHVTLDKSQSKEHESEFENRGGMVHRLDKETSGLLLIAKNEEAFTKLQAQFKSREVKKVYTALIHGKLEPLEGEINAAVGRLPWNRTRFGVLAEGREAATKYKVLKYFNFERGKEIEVLSLLEVYPQTGRTHQIRVHMKHINHPIFADELYAGRKVARRDRKFLGRHFLHASKITFNHPKTGESMTFESKISDSLQSFLSNLSESN